MVYPTNTSSEPNLLRIIAEAEKRYTSYSPVVVGSNPALCILGKTSSSVGRAPGLTKSFFSILCINYRTRSGLVSYIANYNFEKTLALLFSSF